MKLNVTFWYRAKHTGVIAEGVPTYLEVTKKQLKQIEESFKIIKSEFDGRPVYVRKDEHIHAHFLICFVALVVMRVLEQMTDKKYTVKEIRDALKSYSCSYLEQNYYMFDYRDEVLRCMEERFGLDLSKKYMTVSQIKKILEYQK